jgi:hypothetical protein
MVLNVRGKQIMNCKGSLDCAGWDFLALVKFSFISQRKWKNDGQHQVENDLGDSCPLCFIPFLLSQSDFTPSSREETGNKISVELDMLYIIL